MECADGLVRRFYPRIFTYAANYPEKYVTSFINFVISPYTLCIILRALMSSIRNLGGCPCPRCKILRSDIHLMGTKNDRRKRLALARQDDQPRQFSVKQARAAIYNPDPQKCLAVDSAYVERQLKANSLVPTLVSSVLLF